MISHWCWILNERTACYAVDVKVNGLAAKDRNMMYYTPCPRCGYCYYSAERIAAHEEKELLKERWEKVMERKSKKDLHRILP